MATFNTEAQQIIHTVFPIYDRIDKQIRFKENYKSEIAPLIFPTNQILPFQFRRAARENPLTVLKAVTIGTMAERDLLATIGPFCNMTNFPMEGVDYFIYNGGILLDPAFDKGRYYLEFSDGLQTWYSEVFRIKCGSVSVGDFRIINPTDKRLINDTERRIIN